MLSWSHLLNIKTDLTLAYCILPGEIHTRPINERIHWFVRIYQYHMLSQIIRCDSKRKRNSALKISTWQGCYFNMWSHHPESQIGLLQRGASLIPTNETQQTSPKYPDEIAVLCTVTVGKSSAYRKWWAMIKWALCCYIALFLCDEAPKI